ncbi:MAG: hypothetical protein JWO59_2642 [Chloroflexi bacterium]|nr:hypothetical protein [Chloroflexota bacterium]
MSMSSRSQVQMRQGVSSLNIGVGLVVLGGVVGFIFSFLHWYGVTPHGGSTMFLNGWHGWGFPASIIFIVAALIGLGRLAGLAVGPAATEAGLLVVLGVAAVVCTIIFMVTEGNGYGAGFSKGPLYGAWVGLICGIVIALGGLLTPRTTTI